MPTYLENLTGKFFYFRIQTSLLCTYKSLCTQTFHFESCRVLFYGVWMECSLRSFFKSKWILSLHQGITVITRTPFGVSAPVHDSAHKIGRFKSPGLSVYVIIWPGVWAELRLWSQSSSLLPSVHNNLLKIILWKIRPLLWIYLWSGWEAAHIERIYNTYTRQTRIGKQTTPI